MSLSDDLQQATQQLKEQKEESSKKTKKKRSTRAKEWSKDDEMIALFLFMSDASKLIKENYSAKRSISSRAMTLKITTFQSLAKNTPGATASEQTKALFQEWHSKGLDAVKDTTLKILRGELSLNE